MDMPLYIFTEGVLRSNMKKSYYYEKSVIWGNALILLL